MVFTCSWSDWFHEAADEWRQEAWDIIRRCPDLIFQILTKRPERIVDHLPPDWGAGWPNVWLGTSVEDQKAADLRIPILLSIPAKIRWLSIEPLVGPVDLSPWLPHSTGPAVPFFPIPLVRGDPPIQWVVIGGESGHGHTEMDLQWLKDLDKQCGQADVKVFVKQDSGPLPGEQGRIPAEYWRHEFPRVPP